MKYRSATFENNNIKITEHENETTVPFGVKLQFSDEEILVIEKPFIDVFYVLMQNIKPKPQYPSLEWQLENYGMDIFYRKERFTGF